MPICGRTYHRDIFTTGEGVVDSVTVRAFRQHHPGVSFGYSFPVEGKKVVYATDNEIDGILLEDDQHATDSVVMRKIPETQVDFVRGADLLIATDTYTDEEYPNKTGWGHSRASTAVDLAVQAKVRSLAIFTHDPTRADADIDRLVDSCRDRARSHHANLSIFAAREGVELKSERLATYFETNNTQSSLTLSTHTQAALRCSSLTLRAPP